ncbi:hypothetical protein BZB76_4913 [Actinomadura pelletieri DSM 43383]|uniref:Uncharacterized protein n=1 Tax=Actinomadura pelletieri DSM 43383 TaxID=1120940 RepID=A0A495QIZ0_9ACTN|nr:hypothetical protein BZB76_4913 [Actinomadura pelletieri DSM 43383]
MVLHAGGIISRLLSVPGGSVPGVTGPGLNGPGLNGLGNVPGERAGV